MSLDSLIRLWRTDPATAPNFSFWQTSPPRPAQTQPFPLDLPAALQGALSRRGIDFLYSHQHQTWDLARAGKNIVIATGTASGKTLAYNLPVITALINDDTARALYLFPTKALAQDQLATLERVNVSTLNVPTAIYDGDTPQRDRAFIRKKARIILSNPDMLHTGILPLPRLALRCH
jgi:DEAD/DEAH box helicase domain-containing protein